MFSFATKMAHMVAPERVPIYDARIVAFYLLPDAPENRDVENRTNGYLRRHEAVVKEYKRVKKERLLDKSLARFRQELTPQEFTDIKIIDSLIWAFVTWAEGRRGRGRGRPPALAQ